MASMAAKGGGGHAGGAPIQPLTNSERRLYKATYRPLVVPSEEQEATGRVLEKLALVRGLDLQPAELAQLPSSPLNAIAKGLASGTSFAALRTYGPRLAATSKDDLIAFGNAVSALRTSLGHSQRAKEAAAATSAFTYQAQIEPVGQLHLERLEMFPAGIEHGELVHSVPLTPKETVNISHREWTVTTQTFENIVKDSFEGFSETGVTDKTDLAQATDSESRHSSALDVNGSVSASYNGGAYSVTASAAVNYQDQTETSQTEKDSIAHSIATTRNASTRSKKEHKMSFRVSSVAGAEDLAVRVITNPSSTDAMRVDYFQLLRKWRVDLIRYGLRMTYDLVIPNPGLDLITQALEIQTIDRLLTLSSYSFELKIDEVTPDKWLDLSQTYGVALDRPPDPTQPIQLFKMLDPAKGNVEGDVEIPIADGYELASGTLNAALHIHDHGDPKPQFSALGSTWNSGSSSPWDLGVSADLGSYKHTTGRLLVRYSYMNSDSGSVSIVGTATVLPQTIEAWQLKSWSTLRDADQAAYAQRMQQAKDRKAYLQDQISQFDALTLRKMEREEIMRWVLRWLLGPSFELMPQNLATLFQPYPPSPDNAIESAYPDVSTLSTYDWQSVISYGEFIKYIHDAVEWENVLFFAYPYFWDTTKNWPFKRFLVHPDPVHREFLRSGAMRVVLTIRPGFEQSFAMLTTTGDPTQVPPTNPKPPYVTIADDIRNYAMTNYEGIPPANPDNNVRPLLFPLQVRAWDNMQQLIALIDAYHTTNGAYPASLAALGPLPAGVSVTDPWGRPYHYASPGDYGDYDLVCFGADGIPNAQQQDPVKLADPLNADITSYAEGSIVGRWYEYTPTGALDVSINTVLPTKPTPA